MPTGVYTRTKPSTPTQLEALKKGREVALKLPRTQKQREASHKNFIKAGKVGSTLPRTLKQLATARENGRKYGFKKGEPHPHEATVSGDDIIEHHNDLCHGAERPDDVTCMTLSEHISLHNRLRVEDETNPFLAINRQK